MLNKTADNRRKARPEVDQLIFVQDSVQGGELGNIVNLSEDGFVLIGKGKLKINCLYQLIFNLSKPVDNIQQLSVGAECLWLKETVGGGHYWAGFQVIDISDDDRNTIHKIVRNLLA
ncbi:MAG: hypothetical protein ACI9Y1_001002 [Lentisphaeria bacterium]|jgi:hypothetical protein